MLPKNSRLNKQNAFIVNRRGKKHFSQHLKITIDEDKQGGGSKWQIKVFKKTYPLSTDRNKAKRIIREAIKNVTPKIKVGVNIVIQITNKIDKFSVQQTKKEIEELLYKAQLL